jgi:hypothetical protein
VIEHLVGDQGLKAVFLKRQRLHVGVGL